MHRREFIRMAAATAATAAVASHAQDTNTAPQRAARAPSRRSVGEPYSLDGTRLFFQNWHYIHPGEFEWDLPDGRRVRLEEDTPPGEAVFSGRNQPAGIRLRAQPAQRTGPLLKAERPWEEGAGVAFTTTLKDGGIYRAWGAPFTTSGDPPGQKHFTCFESDDGLHWRRPELGIVEFNGSRANNLLNVFGTDGGTVFIDPSAVPAERYKLVAQMSFSRDVLDDYIRRRPDAVDPRIERKPDGSAKALCGAVSPDGLHWTQFRDPLALEVTDTQITGYYDLHLGRYVLYTRTWPAGQRSALAPAGARRAWGGARRSIGRSESDSFREFPVHETILEPGPDLLPTDTLYTNGRTTMPGAPDHHLMFPTLWRTHGDTTAVALASSHDGRVWHFLPGSPVFEPGPFGAFDGGCVFAHPNLIELPNGDFALPYTGYSVPHKYPRGRWNFSPGWLLWPRGRLIALESPSLGEFSTVAFVPPGRRLRINAVTPRGGSLRIEVAAPGGTPVPGRSFADSQPLSGDLFRETAAWKGGADLGVPDGDPVQLRFKLDQVQLYGLEFF